MLSISIEVHGGYIQLYGQIMDTSPTSGQLNVLDGFGTISVTNTTDLPVGLSALSTGPDASGTLRGTSGVIDITDVHLDYAANPNSATPNQVDVTHTVYTRSYDPTDPTGSGDVIEQQQYGVLNSQGIAVYTGALADISTTAGRSASYDPLAGQRYVWTTATVYSAVSYFQHDETTVFGNSNWNFDGVDFPRFHQPRGSRRADPAAQRSLHNHRRHTDVHGRHGAEQHGDRARIFAEHGYQQQSGKHRARHVDVQLSRQLQHQIPPLALEL